MTATIFNTEFVDPSNITLLSSSQFVWLRGSDVSLTEVISIKYNL